MVKDEVKCPENTGAWDIMKENEDIVKFNSAYGYISRFK